MENCGFLCVKAPVVEREKGRSYQWLVMSCSLDIRQTLHQQNTVVVVVQ
jgi:hypothetical protein